jgi:hypothetical protein
MPAFSDSVTRPRRALTGSDRAAVAAARGIVTAPEIYANDPDIRVAAWHTLLWARGQRMDTARIEVQAGLRPPPVAAMLAARMLGHPRDPQGGAA